MANFRQPHWIAPAVLLAAGPAYAEAVILTARDGEAGGRIEARWADGRDAAPAMQASVANGVLTLRFDEPIEADVAGLPAQAPRLISFASVENDGRTVRVALRQDVQARASADGRARIVALSPAGEPQSLRPADSPAPPVAAPAASVTVGQREDLTRLSFRWPGATTVTPRANGTALELRFSRAADIDLAELRANPPRFVRGARLVSAAGQPVRIALTLDPGVRHRHFTDGDRVVVDLLPPDEASLAAAQAAAAPEQAAPPTYRPPTGVATVRIEETADAARISVTWPTPARAAAFRRGEAIWLVFDARGRIDLSRIARAGRWRRDMQVVTGRDAVALRIAAPPEALVSATSEGATWTFTLAPRVSAAAHAPVRRDLGLAERGRIIAAFGREGSIAWLNDPEIGDQIGVAMFAGPALGVAQRRATLEAAVLPSAHGAVMEARADGVDMRFEGPDLVVSRGLGLITTQALADGQARPAEPAAAVAEVATAPQSGAFSADTRRRLDELERRVAAEAAAEGDETDAHLALIDFLLQQQLAAEALGVLRLAAVRDPALESDGAFRLKRAAANIMLGRHDEAQGDLATPSLADDGEAALWRGYAAALGEQWEDARRDLERGAGAGERLPMDWRARFALARAEAALQMGDLPAAEQAAAEASGIATAADVRLRAQFVQARTAAARGRTAEAIAQLAGLTRVRDEELAVRAGLEHVRLQRASGAISAAQAADALEAMRFRWRGDALEVDVVAMLGDVYMELGRWRDALEVMQVASDRYTRMAATRRLRIEMTAAFERLFLDGEADSLEPIQALGLFYQFAELTPVGPNGDRIVRLLAGRLVRVDLLQQAAQLLQHQVDERLQGLGRAQVAADLAAIYLLDGKPEDALQAIAATRVPNMPQTLLAERRVLEAHAMIKLGRFDNAVELVERDQSLDAQRVRAEAAWRARDWTRAAAELNRLVQRIDGATPLDEEGRKVVLRSAIALTMSGDEQGVQRLYRAHAGDMAGTPEADAFEVVASGVNAEGAEIRDLARLVARTDLLDRFLQSVRTRMTAPAPRSAAQTPAPARPAAG